MGVDCKAIVKMKSGELKFIDLDRYTDWEDEEDLDNVLQEPVSAEEAIIVATNIWEQDRSRHFVTKFIGTIKFYKDDIESVFVQAEHGGLDLTEPFYTVKDELIVLNPREKMEKTKVELYYGEIHRVALGNTPGSDKLGAHHDRAADICQYFIEHKVKGIDMILKTLNSSYFIKLYENEKEFLMKVLDHISLIKKHNNR